MLGLRREILEGVNALLVEKKPTWWRRLGSSLSASKEIDRIHRNIIQERVERIEVAQYIANCVGRSGLGMGTPLERYYDRFRMMDEGGAWSQFADVANFFEDRRQKLFGNISVLIGGIVGGIIGALLGATVTSYLSRNVSSPVQGQEQLIRQPLKTTQQQRGRPLTHPAPATAPNTAP